MSEINWKNKAEVLEYLRNGGEEVQKIDRSLLADWSFVREAGRIEPYIFDIADVDLTYDHSDEIDAILQELEEKRKEKEEAYRLEENMTEEEKRLRKIKEGLRSNPKEFLEAEIYRTEDPSESFMLSDIIQVLEEEGLQDLDSIEAALECFIIEEKGYDIPAITYIGDWTVETADQREVTAQCFDTYRGHGDSRYIDFVQKLIEKYGKDFVMQRFGKSIRAKVPNFAFELEGIDLETQEGIDLLIDGYPIGYAERHIHIERMLEELDKRGEAEERYRTAGAYYDEIGEHFLQRGEEMPFEALDWYIYECEDEKKLLRLLIEHGKTIPDKVKEAYGEDTIHRLLDEIELERLQEEDEKLDEAIERVASIEEQQNANEETK